MEEKIVISLGGSLVVPDDIDVAFLKDFKNLISDRVTKGQKFYIIVGGGRTCRKYQHAASEVHGVSNNDLDMIGISTCMLNGMLVKVIFGDLAHEKIITDLEDLPNISNKVVILGPSTPGNSSDLGAVKRAQDVGANKVINLSNIDYAYDKDPNKFPDAKKIERISWADYEKLIPAEWNPGLSTPFDPIASRAAQKDGIEVLILNGKNISNLEKCLNGEDFIGTHIK